MTLLRIILSERNISLFNQTTHTQEANPENSYLMKSILLHMTCFLLLIAGAKAQTDTISTKKGDLLIHPVLHGTLVLEYRGNTIYVDPYGGAEGFAGLPDANLILITDIHGDHCDSASLAVVKKENSHMIVPAAVAEKLKGSFGKPEILANGKKTTWEGITIEALPMYNLPEAADSRHTKGRGNGYLLTIGSKRVYISGDTEDIPEMRALKDIDIAFICMNLPYTMSVDQAADAVNEFKPAIVYPYHFRGKDGLSDIDHFRELIEEEFETEGVEVRLRRWYPQQ